MKVPAEELAAFKIGPGGQPGAAGAAVGKQTEGVKLHMVADDTFSGFYFGIIASYGTAVLAVPGAFSIPGKIAGALIVIALEAVLERTEGRPFIVLVMIIFHKIANGGNVSGLNGCFVFIHINRHEHIKDVVRDDALALGLAVLGHKAILSAGFIGFTPAIDSGHAEVERVGFDPLCQLLAAHAEGITYHLQALINGLLLPGRGFSINGVCLNFCLFGGFSGLLSLLFGF